MTKRTMAVRNILAGGAVVLTTGLGTIGVASAATNHSSPTLNAEVAHGVRDLPSDGPHPGDGPDATPLSGATLTSAEASANAAVPNATVEHAFAGANSTYVVIMKKSDGTHVTVIENSSFVVTSTQAGLPTPPFGTMRGMPRPDGPNSGEAIGSSNR